MPRKPNYKFERTERDRAKAAKKAAKKERTANSETENAELDPQVDGQTPESPPD